MGDSDRAAAETQAMLLRRFRCVAFAALEAGVTVEQLSGGLQVAVDADERRRAAMIPTPRTPLRLVKDTD